LNGEALFQIRFPLWVLVGNLTVEALGKPPVQERDILEHSVGRIGVTKRILETQSGMDGSTAIAASIARLGAPYASIAFPP